MVPKLKSLLYATVLATGLVTQSHAETSAPMNVLPAEVQGIWTAGSCTDDSSDFFVLGPSSMLGFPSDSNQPREFWALSLKDISSYQDGTIIFNLEDLELNLLTPEKDRIVVRSQNQITSSDEVDKEALFSSSPGTRLEHCQRLPLRLGIPYAEISSFVLSDAFLKCQDGGEPCALSLFGFLDVDGNSELRSAEIARGLRIFTLFGLGNQIATSGYDENSFNAALAIMPTFPLVGYTLIAQFDYDGSGGLSMSEIGTDIGAAVPALKTGSDIGSLAKSLPLKDLGNLPLLLKSLVQ